MKVVERKVGDGTVELIVTATAQEASRALDEAQIKFAQDMNLRPDPGKVVAQLAAEQLGIRDLDSVVQHQAAERLIPFALDKRDLCPALRPVPASNMPLARGRSFSFTVRVLPKPAYELESYEPVAVQMPAFSYDTAEVDRQLAHIVNRFVEFPVLKSRRAVKAGDHCFIALEATVDGQPATALSTQGRVYSLGNGYLPAEFDEALIGMKKGETRHVSFTGPKQDENGMPSTGAYECDVTLIELRKKVIPELADEWVSAHVQGFDTVEEMREAIDGQIRTQARIAYDAQIRSKAVEAFAAQFKGQVPAEIYQNTYNVVLASLRNSVAAQGEDYEKYVERMGGHAEADRAIAFRAQQTLAQDYSLDALFAHYELEIEDEDYLTACAEMNPNDPAGVRESMEASGRGFALREVAARHRAARWLQETATVQVIEPQPAAKPEPAAKKAPAKKAPAKKTAAKKAPAKKAPVRKTAAKKLAAKEAAAEVAEKPAAKETTAKKPAATKTAAKKPAAKTSKTTKAAQAAAGEAEDAQAPAKKAPARKAPAKKTAPAKRAAATKAADAEKPAAKKAAAAKKATAAEAAGVEKPAAKKAPARKTAAKKPAAKKTAAAKAADAEKPAAKKAAAKKTPAKKSAAKKTTARKTAAKKVEE